jgi:hypothetical protein
MVEMLWKASPAGKRHRQFEFFPRQVVGTAPGSRLITQRLMFDYVPVIQASGDSRKMKRVEQEKTSQSEVLRSTNHAQFFHKRISCEKLPRTSTVRSKSRPIREVRTQFINAVFHSHHFNKSCWNHGRGAEAGNLSGSGKSKMPSSPSAIRMRLCSIKMALGSIRVPSCVEVR